MSLLDPRVNKNQLESTGAFMAMGRFEPLPQQTEPEKVDPFKESTKQHPGGIFTA